MHIFGGVELIRSHSVLASPASCLSAIPRLPRSISKSRWPTCAKRRSVCLLVFLSLLTHASSAFLRSSPSEHDPIYTLKKPQTKYWISEARSVCSPLTGQLGEAGSQKPEQHEYGTRSASGSHGRSFWVRRCSFCVTFYSPYRAEM